MLFVVSVTETHQLRKMINNFSAKLFKVTVTNKNGVLCFVTVDHKLTTRGRYETNYGSASPAL